MRLRYSDARRGARSSSTSNANEVADLAAKGTQAGAGRGPQAEEPSRAGAASPRLVFRARSCNSPPAA